MFFKEVKQGKAPDAPWEKADGNALHLARTEGFFDLQVIASIVEKLPDEPDESGQIPEFGTWSDTKRQIRLSLLFPQDDKKTVAAVLLYCWQACLEPKVPAIKDALIELSRVAAEQGWVTFTDVIKQPRKANKGGRPKGSRNPKTTVRYVNSFNRLKAENPSWGVEALLNGVVSHISKSIGIRSEYEKRILRINVKKALQSAKLYPKKSRKMRKTT